MTTAASTAPRFNVYISIHKGLRAAMFAALQSLGRASAGDPHAVAAALGETESLLEFMAAHVKHENEHLHTAIEARAAAGSHQTADDHRDHIDHINQLRDAIAALRGGSASADALHTFYLHMCDFVGENLLHMRVEETVNNETLWSLYSDQELIEIHDRLLASVDPAAMAFGMTWMARAVTMPELAAMVADAREKAPPPAFEGLMQLIGAHLDADRLTDLNRRIATEEAVAA